MILCKVLSTELDLLIVIINYYYYIDGEQKNIVVEIYIEKTQRVLNPIFDNDKRWTIFLSKQKVIVNKRVSHRDITILFIYFLLP